MCCSALAVAAEYGQAGVYVLQCVAVVVCRTVSQLQGVAGCSSDLQCSVLQCDMS